MSLKQSMLFFIATIFTSIINGAPHQVVYDPVTSLYFISIPTGSFYMGSSNLAEAVAEMPEQDESIIRDETPIHLVRFKQNFLMATTEVTQSLWLDVMKNKPGPDKHWHHKNWSRLPVVSVSWFDTQKFINKLNAHSNDYHYRLPTESEWEYVARAGNGKLRPFSTLAMDDYAWYINNSNDEIQPVATRQANPWGLYDLYGNVWEWVSDWYHPNSYAHAAAENPTGPDEGSKKVRRGGSYHCSPHLIRPGYRSADNPDKAYSVLGFRLVADIKYPL